MRQQFYADGDYRDSLFMGIFRDEIQKVDWTIKPFYIT
jgi:hypothetical protein